MAERIDVFISSTSKDLEEFRERVIQIVLKMGAYPISMETFTPTDRNALQLCYDKLQEAEVFIGIYAYRYGYAPSSDVTFKTKEGDIYHGNNETSITQWEYQWALELGIPMLLFVVGNQDADGKSLAWPVDYIETEEPGKSRLKAFKKQMMTQHVVGFFHSPDDLASQVAAGLAKVISTRGRTIRMDRLSGRDWGEAPEVETLYGREDDLTKLESWLTSERCRLVLLLGMGGIGKSLLASKLARQTAEGFKYVIWHSLRNAPPLTEILTETIRFLSDQQEIDLPENLDDAISRLIYYLDLSRCLIVFDNVETILQEGQAGEYRDGYENYGQLLKRIAESKHQSCLLLTSREKPKEIGLLEGEQKPTRTHQVKGLSTECGTLMLADKGLSASAESWATLVSRYSGNPLALNVVAEMIREVYDGSVEDFLAEDEIIFGDIQNVIGQQFNRLTPLEQSIMFWLAIEREPFSRDSLWDNIVSFGRKREFMMALEALRRRSLIEKAEPGFTLQNVIMEYVTELLIDRFYEELTVGTINTLHTHPFLEAQTKEYVRESQVRVILKPLAAKLLATISLNELEGKLKNIVSGLRQGSVKATGYAAGNVLNLLLHLGINIRGYDFSRLYVWQAYLQGANLQEVNFSQSDLSKSSFTENFGGILSIAFSSDGTTLAAGTTNHEVRVWQVASGKQISSYIGHTDWVSSVDFSPDNRRIASSSNDQTIRLWNVETGEGLEIRQAHLYRVREVAFSPTDAILASGGGDEMVRLWDINTGQCITELKGHTGWIETVAFSPDGTILASGSADHTVHLWDVKTGQRLQVLQGHTDWIRAVTFDPDGNFVASGANDQTIRLWDIKTGQCLKTLQGHTSNIISVTFSVDGKILASGSSDRTIRFWDIDKGECYKTLRVHNEAVRALVFSPDGRVLASGSIDHTLRLWDATTGQCLKTLQGRTNPVGSVAFAPGGNMLASGSYDQIVRLWDATTGQSLKTLGGHSSSIPSIAFSPDGKTLVSGSLDHTLRLWDLQTEQSLILRGHDDWIWSIAISPDGSLIVSGSVDHTIRLWDLKTGQCRKILKDASRVISVCFNHDGTTIASGSADHTVRLWDVKTEECVKTFQGHTDLVRSVAFSPDGTLLASGSNDHTVRLWNVATGDCLGVLAQHTDVVMGVAFSPHNDLLASGSGDQTIRLWNTHTLECTAVLHGHKSAVWSISFGPDGHLLASSSHDETIRVWDVQQGHCIKTLRPERPYERMNITAVTGLTEAQKTTLIALGAIEEDAAVQGFVS
jgi:WD40 repeat protein